MYCLLYLTVFSTVLTELYDGPMGQECYTLAWITETKSSVPVRSVVIAIDHNNSLINQPISPPINLMLIVFRYLLKRSLIVHGLVISISITLKHSLMMINDNTWLWLRRYN